MSSINQDNNLFAGQSIQSSNGHHLVMQNDGNLVLYRSVHNHDPSNATWSSNTYGRGDGCRFTVQGDGNAVIYDANNSPIWASNTNGQSHGPYSATVEDSGHFVVWDGTGRRLWASRDDAPWQRAGHASGLHGRRFGIRTHSGHYIQAREGGGQNTDSLNSQPQYVSSWETFEGHAFDADHIAFKTLSGHYISAANGGGSEVTTEGPRPNDWEKFKVERVGDGYAFRAISGHYLCAEHGGGSTIVVNRDQRGEWETFRIEFQ